MNTIAALIMGAAAAALVTALLGLAIIPWLRKLHFGQTILEIGPKWHEKKQGTPTMGGLMFIFGTIAAVAVTVITDKLLGGDIVDSSATGASIIELYTKFYSGIIFALSVALIGFADDYIKVVKKRNLGLTEKQKTILQSLVIIAYLVSLYMGMGKEPYMFIPFAGNVQYGRILLDLRLCRYLCRDKCSQFHRRHRRTLLERYDNLRSFHVRYCLYA